MAYAHRKIIGSTFVYISNILNYSGDKLKRNMYLMHTMQKQTQKVGYCYRNIQEINVFWSICRNIRSNESGLKAVGKHF